MAIDLSKISKEQLDQIIKEEAYRRRAEMLAEQKSNSRAVQLAEMKAALESELKQLEESADMDENILGKLFGQKKGPDGAKRTEMIATLLSHPNKGPELLKYASDEQAEEFKKIAPKKAAAIDKFVKGGGRKGVDPARTESYITAYLGGAKYVSFDPKTNQYVDSAQVAGNVASAFGEAEEPQA